MDLQKNPIPLIAGLAAVVVTGLLVGLCAGTTDVSSDETIDSVSTSSQPTIVSTSSQLTIVDTETTEPSTAAEALDAAVDALVKADAYGFKAFLLITVGDEPTEVELEGWVDGSDRELKMTIERQSVTTRVIDGVATVERDDETVEVALEEAGDAPSILILKSIQAPTFEDPITIVGRLNSSDLATTNFDVNGAATVEVRLDSEGNLTGYKIVSNNESWSIEVSLFDIGADFAP